MKPATAAAKPAPINEAVELFETHRTIYTRAVTGFFNHWRWVMVFVTQALFYGLCWIDWNGRQAVLFHLVERKFYIFGMVFWPQDAIYLAILLVISAYALFLFTAIAGRLFCGYACPQTVYTEIFMWIERKVEGERTARIKLDRQPWSGHKLRLKLLKHGLWALLALWTGATFVSYFTPVREVMSGLASATLGGWETFWIFGYATVTYLFAGFMREQVCKYMCPYARFQSVMFDPDTLIVTYDAERGEPRGARRKNTEKTALGECVDCSVCVQVCPTGIDIRNGLQYECIGCAACVDACDEIMDKMNYPRGLIRYSTENAIARKMNRQEMLAHVLRPRVLLYSAILVSIIAAAAWSLVQRIPLKVDILRDRSLLAREIDDGRIENVYTLQIMNTDEKPHRYLLSAEGLPAIALASDQAVEVPAATTQAVTVGVRAEADAGSKGANRIYFAIEASDDPAIKVREKASFMLP
ncbi:MAG: cytochrome c oxidase accessory protein CcoG [Accumulibacter sp.]|uniref:cytochrome c oxidase accessory protein CcoG n=1 Tax=Accumulibacter sp. TaxID=2053492 RepID=UPI0033163AAF